MEKYIKELEQNGCTMIPGLYRELGEGILEAKYFYFTSKKYNTIGFGALTLIEGKCGAIVFSSDSMPLCWLLAEDFVKALQEESTGLL